MTPGGLALAAPVRGVVLLDLGQALRAQLAARADRRRLPADDVLAAATEAGFI